MSSWTRLAVGRSPSAFAVWGCVRIRESKSTAASLARFSPSTRSTGSSAIAKGSSCVIFAMRLYCATSSGLNPAAVSTVAATPAAFSCSPWRLVRNLSKLMYLPLCEFGFLLFLEYGAEGVTPLCIGAQYNTFLGRALGNFLAVVLWDHNVLRLLHLECAHLLHRIGAKPAAAGHEHLGQLHRQVLDYLALVVARERLSAGLRLGDRFVYPILEHDLVFLVLHPVCRGGGFEHIRVHRDGKLGLTLVLIPLCEQPRGVLLPDLGGKRHDLRYRHGKEALRVHGKIVVLRHDGRADLRLCFHRRVNVLAHVVTLGAKGG